jgi:hypothetical protein
VKATAVLNLAALLASDLDMPEVARAWCHRHVAAYLKDPALGPVGARRLLEPMINLARLQIRAGQGERAAALVHDLYTAVDTRTDTVIDGIELPASTMTGDAENHQEIRRWLWAVMLATTARALAASGRWGDARAALERMKGVGKRRMLERVAADDADGAIELVRTTEADEAWEHVVTQCLAALCNRVSGQHPTRDELLSCYLDLKQAPELAVFHTRLGLAVIDTLGGPEQRPCRAAALDLITTVVRAGDGYAAQDLLGAAGYENLMSGSEIQHLRQRVHACGLGRGSLPAASEADLARALDASEAVIART